MDRLLPSSRYGLASYVEEMDLGADAIFEVLGDAEFLLTTYGFDLEHPPSAVQLAIKMTGSAPERAHMRVFEAYTLPLPSRRIFISHVVDDVRERFLTFHELAELHYQRLGYRGDDLEARCNAMASAMCAPRPAMKRALRKYGHSVYDLALAMKTPQAATVLRIAEVTGRPCALERSTGIIVRGMPSVAGYFDWLSLSGITIVSSTTTVVTITTGLLPASLVAAVAAGRQPRIQFSLTTQSPLPFQRRIISASVVGATTLYTLDSALPVAPANGSTIYPGGGCVDAVALAVLGYVDAVGPSQQSGLQDSVTDAWEAVVSIGRIAQAALGAVDATGARVLVYSPSVGSGVGVTIKVGAGAASGNDFLLYDNVPGQGPQLPECSSVIVLQGS